MEEIDSKIPLKECIADREVKTKIIIIEDKEKATSSEEDGTRYICTTCLKKLKVAAVWKIPGSREIWTPAPYPPARYPA